MQNLRFDDRLQCFVESLHYDFTKCTGTLLMGIESNCNMSGCIAIFEAIDPRVQEIATFAREAREDHRDWPPQVFQKGFVTVPDTSYHRKGGDWFALPANDEKKKNYALSMNLDRSLQQK